MNPNIERIKLQSQEINVINDPINKTHSFAFSFQLNHQQQYELLMKNDAIAISTGISPGEIDQMIKDAIGTPDHPQSIQKTIDETGLYYDKQSSLIDQFVNHLKTLSKLIYDYHYPDLYLIQTNKSIYYGFGYTFDAQHLLLDASDQMNQTILNQNIQSIKVIAHFDQRFFLFDVQINQKNPIFQLECGDYCIAHQGITAQSDIRNPHLQTIFNKTNEIIDFQTLQSFFQSEKKQNRFDDLF